MPRQLSKNLPPLSRNPLKKNQREDRRRNLLLKSWYLLSPSSLPIPATTPLRFSSKATCGSEVKSPVQMIA